MPGPPVTRAARTKEALRLFRRIPRPHCSTRVSSRPSERVLGRARARCPYKMARHDFLAWSGVVLERTCEVIFGLSFILVFYVWRWTMDGSDATSLSPSALPSRASRPHACDLGVCLRCCVSPLLCVACGAVGPEIQAEVLRQLVFEMCRHPPLLTAAAVNGTGCPGLARAR